MPKSLLATDLAIEGLSMQTDRAGAVTGLTAGVNVSYGDARVREQFDLWAELSENHRVAFQRLYDKLAQRLQAVYLA